MGRKVNKESMTTKLSRFCDGLMEALWLAAIIVIPLFFNVYSSRIFEPDKIAILRTISLLIVGAWLVKIVEQGGVSWDSINKGEAPLKSILKIPLIAPVAGLAVVYVIATIFSVSPTISLLGSYQRLQGTYTTLSYLVIFAAIVGNLRSRNQVEKIITVVIVTSLPIALYGVLQRYGLDPVPWEGDVAVRIASSLGNSIFVAAYVIMAFPLTIGRIVNHFRAILEDDGHVIIHMVNATAYVFIAALHVIALYLSGSRGPAMGWLSSTFFLGLLLIIALRKRWIVILVLIASLLIGGIFFIFNIEQGPFENLRNSTAIGRFGRLLDPESNSALVRRYIWEGAANLVAPHDPLQYPDGSSDMFNLIRPVVGYGPESMFVAYNPFYVPELGRVERRNASPDRSHNETWDALITTGALGLIVYVILFTAIFYYAIKWLGFISDQRQRILFWLIYVVGGVAGAVGLSLWRGIPYAGVGLPFGLVLGLFVYLFLVSLSQRYDRQETKEQVERYLTLSILVSAILAHFLEINFGIAIVATRTYFWIFAALLLVVGYILPLKGEYGIGPGGTQEIKRSEKDIQISEKNLRSGKARKNHAARGQERKRKNKLGRARGQLPGWMMDAIVPGLLTAIILVTLGYDLIGNPRNMGSAFSILWMSLTQLERGASIGIILMMLFTWIISGILLALEIRHFQQSGKDYRNGDLKYVLFVLGVSLILGVLYWMWHTYGLATLALGTASTLQELIAQVAKYENLLTKYYVYVFLLVIGVAIGLSAARAEARIVKKSWTSRGAVASIIILPMIIVLATYSNLNVIKADIAFRIAGSFAGPNQWPVAVEIFKRANRLAPGEDFYYLSLAGAYFEQAKSIEDPAERDQMMIRAEQDLLRAQELNPLNTDHTGNLARLYNLWASYAEDSQVRDNRLQKSSSCYATAVTLSPNNSRIWDEWALLFLNGFQQPDESYRLLNHALEIDPEYDWTYGLLGDYYVRLANQIDDPDEKKTVLEMAVEKYETALKFVKYYEAQNKYGYILNLAGTYAQLNKINLAIETYEQALNIARSSDIWRIEDTLARLYFQNGDLERALIHARNAYLVAPENYKERIEKFIFQLGGTPQ